MIRDKKKVNYISCHPTMSVCNVNNLEHQEHLIPFRHLAVSWQRGFIGSSLLKHIISRRVCVSFNRAEADRLLILFGRGQPHWHHSDITSSSVCVQKHVFTCGDGNNIWAYNNANALHKQDFNSRNYLWSLRIFFFLTKYFYFARMH